MKIRLGFTGTLALLVSCLFLSPLALAKSDLLEEYGFTSADNESYLTEADIFFIRPGLKVEIMDVAIPADLQPEVTFKLTDPAGLPLDREGVFTPGPVSTSFILSYIPEGDDAYVAYTVRDQTSPITGDTATQASSDSGGTYAMLGDGMYMYKFGTVLPADYDADATHTLGMYARRDLTEFDLDRYVANPLEHFVPSGMGEAMPRSVVTTATCNGCHDPLAIHGGSRQEVGLCILCHNPTQSIDPDTGDSVDMPYMVHKIHAGAELENGYTIIGYRQSVHDYSDVVFPPALTDCQVCHTGGVPTDAMPLVLNPSPVPTCDGSGVGMTEVMWGDEGTVDIRVNAADGPVFAKSGAANSKMTGKWVRDTTAFFMVDAATGDVIDETEADTTVLGCANNPPGAFRGEPAENHTAWMTNPSRAACGTCHDTIDFEEGIGHPVQDSDDACGICHQPTGPETGISVAGVHTTEWASSQLDGIYVDISEVTDTDPGDRPTVLFRLYDKFGNVAPAEFNRLRFTITGPNKDFEYYNQEDVLNGVRWTGSTWAYTFNEPLPNDAMGSFSVGVEGRISTEIDKGQGEVVSHNDQIQNFIMPFAVTDSGPMSRREVVSDEKCESCHNNLSLHGENRHDAGGYCQTCHRPDATDEEVRLEGEPVSINFSYMIHKIHSGAELENGYVVYGYRSSVHDYSHVEYVGDRRNCEACHINDSQYLPLPAGLEPVITPNELWSPMQPATAACTSCHDGTDAKVHADLNTSSFGEACSVCHGEGKTYSVEAVHAR